MKRHDSGKFLRIGAAQNMNEKPCFTLRPELASPFNSSNQIILSVLQINHTRQTVVKKKGSCFTQTESRGKKKVSFPRICDVHDHPQCVCVSWSWTHSVAQIKIPATYKSNLQKWVDYGKVILG